MTTGAAHAGSRGTSFSRPGSSCGRCRPGTPPPGSPRGLSRLVAVARGHLADALRFTLLIPVREIGIRRFCLRALGMAVLTLRRVHAHPAFTDVRDVRVSRRAVHATVIVTNALASSDPALKFLFKGFTRRLPPPVQGRGGASA